MGMETNITETDVKLLITMILELQRIENLFMDFARRLRNKLKEGDGTDVEGNENKEKMSRLGGFLDAKKNDEDEEINPMDNEFYTIYRG